MMFSSIQKLFQDVGPGFADWRVRFPGIFTWYRRRFGNSVPRLRQQVRSCNLRSPFASVELQERRSALAPELNQIEIEIRRNSVCSTPSLQTMFKTLWTSSVGQWTSSSTASTPLRGPFPTGVSGSLPPLSKLD